MSNIVDQFSELLSSPLGDLIASIGRGVGEAQAALDAGSLAQTLEMYREDSNRSPEQKRMIDLMREIGYQPTFYTLPETECEAQVSISLGISLNEPSMQPGGGNRTKMYATPLNAGNINKYNLNANASARLKFKIVPVPTESIISEIRILPKLVDKKFSEAKSLLESLGLAYELEAGVKEDEILEIKIASTIPPFVNNTEKRLRLGDVVKLFLVSGDNSEAIENNNEVRLI